MHIARFSNIYFSSGDISENTEEKKYRVGNTDVYVMLRIKENEARNYRAIAIRKYFTNQQSNISHAHENRVVCEEAIEHIANLYSISVSSPHIMYSQAPSIAFRPDTEGEHQYIEALRKEFTKELKSRSVSGGFFLMDKLSSIDFLSDRKNGVAALSAAVNCTTKLSQYRELVRFFEMAFSMPFTQIDKKLSQFLGPALLNFSRDEVKRWSKFRHPSMHGDGAITQEISFEWDVAPYIERMKLAAYDVLLNKARWGKRCANRRKVHEIPGFTLDEKSLVASSPISLGFQVMDQFDKWTQVGLRTYDLENLEKQGWIFFRNEDKALKNAQ